jgi:hypothetical protein
MSDFCDGFNILDLKLPYTLGDSTFFEENSGGNRWLYAYNNEIKNIDEFKKKLKILAFIK